VTTVKQILTAAKRLKPADFLSLQRQLSRLEQRLWEAERSRAADELAEAGIDDRQIDKMVLRRRRESRS
jgi:hypothetical protein